MSAAPVHLVQFMSPIWTSTIRKPGSSTLIFKVGALAVPPAAVERPRLALVVDHVLEDLSAFSRPSETLLELMQVVGGFEGEGLDRVRRVVDADVHAEDGQLVELGVDLDQQRETG